MIIYNNNKKEQKIVQMEDVEKIQQATQTKLKEPSHG
jgi:hypothetical protein